jgi:hypothetical protein
MTNTAANYDGQASTNEKAIRAQTTVMRKPQWTAIRTRRIEHQLARRDHSDA